MSFYPRSGRRAGGGGRRGFMSSGWSQPIFNMHPLDVISNFVSPVLDIVSPLEDIKDLMNQGLSWYQRTPTMLPKQLIQQQRRRVKTKPSVQRLPQKYRIVIDCTGFNPNALRTNIKCVQDNKHLIVSSDIKKGRQFKRSFTLPKEVETKKMTKYVTPQSQLVVEFNYVDTPMSLAISPQPKICTMPEHGKCVHVNVPIADFVDPAKVQLHVKGRELIVRFEERVIPCGDSCSRVLYHNRVRLPDNVNVNAIKAKSDKHKLTILAPLGAAAKKGGGAISQELRNIPVQRKLRHRKARAVTGVGEERKPQVTGEKKPKVQPSITEKQKKKTPLETTAKPKTTDIGEKKPSITEPTISKKKEKKPSLLEKKPEEQKPSILKPEEQQQQQKPSILEKKPEEQKAKSPAEQLAGVTSEEKKKQKKKKSKKTTTAATSSTVMPTATPTETATTSTTPTPPVSVPESSADRPREEKERSPVRSTEKGTDILKNIFESGGPSSSAQQGTTSSTTQSASSASAERAPEERQQIGDVSGSNVQL